MLIMRCVIFICVALVPISCASVSPVYSPRYSNVRYQGVDKSSQYTKEESNAGMTEIPKNSTIPDDIEPTADYLIPNEVTTSNPESEQVDFIFFPKKNGDLELVDEVQVSNEETNTEFEEVDPKKQEMYYIFHPNGLLRKFVYVRNNEGENVEDVAQLKYGNVVPIIEPVYSYDPSTFVFQRLQLYTG